MALIILSGNTSLADTNSGSLAVSPDLINISAFYNGSEVQISANVPACDNAVIVLEGKDEEVTLNRKGRVGPIWLNVAQLTIDGLPDAYILATSDNLDSICSLQEQNTLRLGKHALRELMQLSSNKPLTGKEFDEFLKLKVHNHTYNMKEKVELEPGQQGTEKVSTHFKVPSIMAPGDYKICLFCFKDGKVENQLESSIKIERTGMPKLMNSLAYDYAALYGLIAILVAMGVGILMDIIFNSVPGSGH